MLIDAKKPLIGHNMFYDIIYLYGQFIAKLPDTYLEFVDKWNECFPLTYDNKVITANSKYFFKTWLGELYEKCKSDAKLKEFSRFKFDEGFTNYEGKNLEDHYHEAAYDAYMTGFVFAHVLKFREVMDLIDKKKDLEKQARKNKGKKKDKDGF